LFDIILTYLFLASGIVANKFLLQGMSPDLFVGIRMFVSGLILVPWNIRRSSSLTTFWQTIKTDAWSLLFIALCTTLLPAIIKAFALKYMTASKTALLGSIDPFVTALYAYILWSEKLSFKKIVGIFLGFCGVIISIFSTTATELAWGEFLYISYPELAAIASVVISRYGWILVQLMLKKERYKPTEINSLTMLVSGFLALMIALISGSAATSSCIAPQYIMIFAYTIIVGNLFGYTLYGYCLRKHSATLMSLAGFLVPVFVFSISHLLGREQLSLNFALAALVLFAGLCVFYFDDIKSQVKRQ
jgi:drug/metabolite transporter (DMT)-like permease